MNEYATPERLIRTKQGWIPEQEARENGVPGYRIKLSGSVAEEAARQLRINPDKVYINDIHGKKRAEEVEAQITEKARELQAQRGAFQSAYGIASE